jgi:GNAT superfamily N-acetyltransferase
MLIKTYTDEQIFARPTIVSKLRELTNQGQPHDFYSGSAMRDDLRARRAGQFFLAWHSGKIIAWALMNRTWDGNLQLGCYVQPTYRRKGIGSKLCNKAKKFAAKTGEAIHFQDSRRGLGYDMYEKAGFEYAMRCSG